MEISAQTISKIRQETGYGLMDIKKALLEAAGNEQQALELLRAKGLERIGKRADRQSKEGYIEAYSHGGRIAVIVEVNCETDFVAKTEDFRAFVHDLALQISSMTPENVDTLLQQPFVKEPSRTVGDLFHDLAQKTGEKLEIRRFARYELGQD